MFLFSFISFLIKKIEYYIQFKENVSLIFVFNSVEKLRYSNTPTIQPWKLQLKILATEVAYAFE